MNVYCLQCYSGNRFSLFTKLLLSQIGLLGNYYLRLFSHWFCTCILCYFMISTPLPFYHEWAFSDSGSAPLAIVATYKRRFLFSHLIVGQHFGTYRFHTLHLSFASLDWTRWDRHMHLACFSRATFTCSPQRIDRIFLTLPLPLKSSRFRMIIMIKVRS